MADLTCACNRCFPFGWFLFLFDSLTKYFTFYAHSPFPADSCGLSIRRPSAPGGARDAVDADTVYGVVNPIPLAQPLPYPSVLIFQHSILQQAAEMKYIAAKRFFPGGETIACTRLDFETNRNGTNRR